MVLETGSLRSGSVWFVDVLLDPFREGEMALPLYMDINPNMEVPPSRPSHLPKAPPPHTITWGMRLSAYELWRNMSIQTMDRAPVSVGTAIDFRLFFQNVLATLVHTTFPCDINGHEIRAFISEKKNTLLCHGLLC